jgi:hypothetical protein
MTIHTPARVALTHETTSGTSVDKGAGCNSRAKQLDWPAIISEWQASGLTKRDFCTKRSLSYENFVYHSAKKTKQDNPSPKLLPLKIANDPSSMCTAKTNHFTLYYPNGTRLSIPAQADKDTLKLILSCLGEV